MFFDVKVQCVRVHIYIGLKFTLTPKVGNEQELTENLNAFHRKLRVAEYFDGTEDEEISFVRN